MPGLGSSWVFESGDSEGPNSRRLFFIVVDRRESKKGERDFLKGKAACLRHFNTEVLVDDREDVCDNCTEAGILCYPVIRHKVSLSGAVSDLIADIGSGRLWDKLLDTYSARTW